MLHRRELPRVALGDRGEARAEVVVRDDRLTFGRVQVLEIGLRDGASSLLVDDASTSATGGSARMLSDGPHDLEACPVPSFSTARSASFSQAISTSPMPRSTNVVVEPRAPESSTGTFL